jgi:hypothetical protein
MALPGQVLRKAKSLEGNAEQYNKQKIACPHIGNRLFETGKFYLVAV